MKKKVIKFIKSLFKCDSVENKDEKKVVETENSSMVLSKARLFGRIYGYCWALLEKRDPEYDGEKLKKESPMVVLLKAMNFANDKEMQVLSKLMDTLNEMSKSSNGSDPTQEQLENIKGALEGKLVEYKHLDPSLLLEAKEIG